MGVFPSLPTNIAETVEEFRVNLIAIAHDTEIAADAAVAALMGEYGTERAAELMRSAQRFRAATEDAA